MRKQWMCNAETRCRMSLMKLVSVMVKVRSGSGARREKKEGKKRRLVVCTIVVLASFILCVCSALPLNTTSCISTPRSVSWNTWSWVQWCWTSNWTWPSSGGVSKVPPAVFNILDAGTEPFFFLCLYLFRCEMLYTSVAMIRTTIMYTHWNQYVTDNQTMQSHSFTFSCLWLTNRTT